MTEPGNGDAHSLIPPQARAKCLLPGSYLSSPLERLASHPAQGVYGLEVGLAFLWWEVFLPLGWG